MLQLHVWGVDGEISVISPECLASAWLLNEQFSEEFTIVMSNNTNYSDIGILPVLIDETRGIKCQGFEQIVDFINFKFEDVKLELLNQSLMSLLNDKFAIINQYNLYINRENYANYTIKLFKNYLPFPMMYNQPLKLHGYAQQLVQTVGLSSNKGGFFNFAGNTSVVPATETVNEDEDDEEAEEVALTSLHEKQLLRKSTQKQALQEAKTAFKCVNILNHQLDLIWDMYKQTPELKQGANKYLLQAYLISFINENLPDRFIHDNLTSKYSDKLKEMTSDARVSNEKIQGLFCQPVKEQVPSLINEVKYLMGYIKY